ncbi:MAG: FAD-dependent oxidoreductase, partial [Bryobacteraceae bacterium]
MSMTLQGEVFGSGAGDDKIQAYALLITIKDYGPGANKTIPKPPHYDPKNYAPEKDRATFWYRGGMLPNHKAEVNEMLDGTDAVDLADLNKEYINGTRADRHRVWEKYRDYSLGYLYFRQTAMGDKNWGLPDDEFTDNGNVPYELYVREGRRLEGVYMFSEPDAIRVPGFPRPPLQKDSIAVGDWSIDSHPVARDTEGYIYLHSTSDQYKISAPYQAPYGVMVPKTVDGLLVPMAVSATHVGFQVLRLEPIRVSMGQAAGDAAALCVKRHIQPRDVPVRELQRMLLDQGNALFYYTDVPPANPYFQDIQYLSQAGAVRGFDDFSFRPNQPATNAELAKIVFHGLNLKVKMDYTDLWKVMRWHRGTQYSTPYHWATYYLLTLKNMGAFSDDA